MAELVAYCDVKRRREMRCPQHFVLMMQPGALEKAQDAQRTAEELDARQDRLLRIDKWAKRKAQREEAERMTVERSTSILERRARVAAERFARRGARRESHQTQPRRIPARCRRPRSRRIVRRACARAPDRPRLADEDPLDPPPAVIFAHDARAVDPRVARWLERWGEGSS